MNTSRILGNHRILLSIFVSNISWLSLGEGIGRGINFVSNTLLARMLGTGGYGLFIFIQSILYYIGFGINLGTSRYGIKEIAKRHTTDFIPALVGIRFTSGVLLLVGALVFIYTRHVTYWKHIAIIFTMYILSYPFYVDWIFKGQQKFKHVAIGKIIFFGSFLVFTITVIHKWPNPIYAMYLWVASFLLSNAYMWYMYTRSVNKLIFPNFYFPAWREHLSESMHFAVSGAMMAFYEYMPIIILKAKSFSFGNIGLFSAPFRISVMISGIGFLVMEASYPVFARIYHNNTAEFARTHRVFVVGMTIFSSAIAGLLSLFAPEFVRFFLGSTYEGSVGIFRALAWLIPLYYTRYVYGSVLGATGNQIYYVPVAIVGGVALLGTFFVLMSHGLMGMAYALLVANGAIDVTLILIYYKVVLRQVTPVRHLS